MDANRIYSVLACSVLLSAAALWSPAAFGADIYDAAVQHAGRSAEDLKRDESEHPAEVLRLSGIKPGMKVGDVMAAGGYYSELLSYIVGPKGHVLLLNNTAYDHWSEGGWEKRLANNRLPNVEHRTIDLEHIDLPDNSLDALWLMKTYHDFYWIDTDPKAIWPKMDAGVVLDQFDPRIEAGWHCVGRGSLRETWYGQHGGLIPPPDRRNVHRARFPEARLQAHR